MFQKRISFTNGKKGAFMENKTFYYARVSSRDQNLERQISAFKSLGADDRDIYCDKKSGKDFDRENYLMLKKSLLRTGDTLVIKELDRLGRNKAEIKKELEYFKEQGIHIKILDIPTTILDIPKGQEWIWDMVNGVLIEVLGTIAEQERRKIIDRQREGLNTMPIKNGKKVSNRTGRSIGRPTVEYPEKWEEYYIDWKDKKITAIEFRNFVGLKKTTFYRLLKTMK